MKAGDEITFDGKTYVAAEAEFIARLMGLRFDSDGWWRGVCDYCTDVCQIDRGSCIKNLYRDATGDEGLSTCIKDTPPVYLFLKPEPRQPITGEPK